MSFIKKIQLIAARFNNLLIAVANSNRFFYGILALTALQGLWYAFSIQPSMYDEPTHLGFIDFYTQHISPFVSHQGPQWDYLGEVSREGSYMFYYLMSWPARVVEFFTDNRAALVIVLRLITIAIFLLGLYVYRKVLLKVGASKALVNTALLILVLTPILAPIAGVVNYDSAVFLLSALLFLVAIWIIQANRLNITHLLILLIIGFFGSEIKYEFVAIFVPVILYIIYDQLRKKVHKQNYGFDFSLSKWRAILLIVATIISLGLFIERPVYNFVRYHNPGGASCEQILSQERCSQSSVVHRNQTALAAKPADFNPIDPITYTSVKWLPTMVGTLIIVLARTPVYVVPDLFYYVFIYGGIVVILLYTRQFIKKPINSLLLFSMLIYSVGLLMFLYESYVHLGAAYGMNGRYLLPILPVLILFTLVGLKYLFNTRLPRLSPIALFLAVALLFFQGGGIGTAGLQVPTSVEWDNIAVRRVNTDIKTVLHHVVFERNPFNNPFQ